MIKRIINPEEFDQLLDDIFELFELENKKQAHALLQHNKTSIKANYSHLGILAWDFFVWGNKTNDKFDAVIAFFHDKNAKFGKKIFSEFVWLSKNPKVGYKLFSEACDFARLNNFEYIVMNTVVRNPSHEKVKSFYTKMGLVKDSETYIGKL
jgi:transcriptional accessory protein Tex/SPT6